jgi:predicted Zn-dependent peptidase
VQDNPSDLVHDLYAMTLWKDQPIGQPVIGNSRTVSSFRRSHLLDFMCRNYQSPGVVVAASGNVSHDRLVELVEKKLRMDKADGHFLPRRTNPRSFKEVKLFKRKGAQTHVCLGVPALKYSHPQRYALTLLNIVLGGGMSSHLFQTIREKLGLAYSIYSFVDFFEDTGTWGIYLATDAKQVPKAVDYSLREVKRMKREPLTRSELQHAKEQLKGNIVISFENSSNRMNRLARNELYLKRYIHLDQTMKEIERTTSEEIQAVANQLLQPDRLTAVVLGPVENGLQRGIETSLDH